MERCIQILKYAGISFFAVLITSWASPIIYRALHRAGYFSSSINFQICDDLISICLAFYLFRHFKSHIEAHPDRWNIWKSICWFVVFFVVNFILQTRVVHYGSSFYEYIYANQTHLPVINSNPNELSNSSQTWLLITTVIYAPLFEELFFRGWLYALWSRVYTAVPVLFITTFFFALSHLTNTVATMQDLVSFSLTTFPAVMVTGFFLGLIRSRFSIVHSIAFHAIFNGFLIWLDQLKF